MAKAKKKEVLSLEEQLEQTLVPVNEQPYEVPENWCWVRFDSLSKDMADGPFGSNLKTEHYTENKEVRIIQLSNIGEEGWREENTKYTTFEHVKTIARSIVEPGNIVIAKMMPAGRAIICPSSEKMYVLSSDAVKMVPHSKLDVKYLVYCINSQMFRNQVQENTQGITRARTSIKKLKQYVFPLPPLAEQQRIVKQIESLFARLDEAKEKLEDAIGGIELRKAAILHKAFGGQLTMEWRNMNGIELSSWEHKLFRNILDVRDGTHDSPQYYDEGYPLITSKNLKNGIITDKDIKYISKEDYEQINLRSKVDVGDVLFAMIGTIGNPVVVVEEPNYAIKNMALFKNIGQINPFFLKYYLDSKTVKDKMQKEAKGSTQKFVALGYLRDFPISVPSVDEQAEIVRILDVMLGKENDVEVMLQNTMEQIELMKKSVLAKAFRGELGTNNPEEESATELLKSILVQE